MHDPFKGRDPMLAIAHAAVPILVDRLGGTVVVSEIELAALSKRYGGSVGVSAVQEAPGSYRLTVVSVVGRSDPNRPTS